MKVSLFVPLVFLPFFAACSPAIHNTDLLRNINQEEVADHSFSAEENSEESEGINHKKVFVPSRAAGRALAEKTAANNLRREGTSVQQAVVVYSSELVPIVEAGDEFEAQTQTQAQVEIEGKEREAEALEAEALEAEETKKAKKEPRSFASLPVSKQRYRSAGKFLPAPSGSAASKGSHLFSSLPALKQRNSSTRKFLPVSST
ncbi:MAG: hypothetical protein D3925_14720, partial [Candidatus Electrothrix sp. AR5]|nr:hypothetical protein [Candidatus Electrothrix sp. AR5]